MEKVDFKKDFCRLYRPSAKTAEIVDFPAMNILQLDGRGAPADPVFQQAVAAVYGVAYAVKFGCKKQALGHDFSMGPLEASWYGASGKPFDVRHPASWRWTVMLWLPDFITKKDVAGAAALALKKHPEMPADKVALTRRPAHRAAQIMHVGSYDQEGPTIDRLLAFIKEQGLKVAGHHTEVYLSDPRRSAPPKLKTIIRLAVK